MKPTRARPFNGDGRAVIGESASQSLPYLIPLVDEVDHVMTLTCRYCGMTTGPFELADDGDDYLVSFERVFHLLNCPLALDVKVN